MNEQVNLPTDTISGPRIELRAVTHTYRTESGPLPVLDDLSFTCADRSFTAVVGPSGCGKSTLTRLVAGLLMPDEGDVFLHGEKVSGPRATVGMAFQNPVLLEWRSIIENVMLDIMFELPDQPRGNHYTVTEAIVDGREKLFGDQPEKKSA